MGIDPADMSTKLAFGLGRPETESLSPDISFTFPNLAAVVIGMVVHGSRCFSSIFMVGYDTVVDMARNNSADFI